MEYLEIFTVRIGARIGTAEIALLIILALLIFGGNRLSGLGKSLGTSIREFKNETANLNSNDETKLESEKTQATKEEETND